MLTTAIDMKDFKTSDHSNIHGLLLNINSSSTSAAILNSNSSNNGNNTKKSSPKNDQKDSKGTEGKFLYKLFLNILRLY